jgi:hypothetical protein
MLVKTGDSSRGGARRCWTMRGDNVHGIVHLAECPLTLELRWSRSLDDSVRRVGVFCLDLTALLRGDYIRPEPLHWHGSPDVRLRIVRADGGNFYVQKNQSGPALLLPNRDV